VPAPIASNGRLADNRGVLGLRIAAWAVGLGIAVELAVGLASYDWHSDEDVPLWVLPLLVLALLVPTCVGLLIATRQPRNTVAWVMLVGVLALILVASPGLENLIGTGWALQIDRATWPLLYAWPIAIAFVFPDGRLLTPRWRWVAAAAVASFVGFMFLALLDPDPFEGKDASVPNPLAGNGPGEALGGTGIWIPFWLGILASLFAGVAAVWLRFRRSTGIERLQVMWLAWSALLIPLGLLLCAASWLFMSGPEELVFVVLLLMWIAVSAAIGVAVVRYRLYAIERLVNRTLVYGVLTVLLGAVYVALTAILGVAVGGGSAWVTAAATLAVAVAFRPLRAAVQDVVDRRFNRARYQGVRRVRTFEEQVREGARAPEEIVTVLAEALGDPLVELVFWLPESATYATAAGELVDTLPDDGRARTEAHRDGVPTAVLLHDPALLVRRDLLNGVLAAAALSIEIARLRVEVRNHLAEVEASRARIVEAGYEERRRLERDLHDGAQQRLVSLGVQIRRLQRTLPRSASVLSPAFDQIVGEVAAAISDLRQIAAGVRPARLDDGLAAALRDLARTAPVPVEVDVPVGRVTASVEAAAYFVACEALTNAVKHAAASKVSVRAVRENGSLVVSVSDDGIGGAKARRGSGLAGLQDRVAAHGGSLEILSPRGRGTRIEVAIPCDS
jgi:signal transduction histidine kinase